MTGDEDDPTPGHRLGPARLLRGDTVPLWEQLRSDIAGRIRSGAFEDGDFPGEHSLAATYEVSRQTVRLALRSLRESGVLIAEPGRTPRVGRTIEQPLGTLYSLFSSVEATGATQRSIVRQLELRSDSRAATRLALGHDQPVVFLERLRLVEDEPLALDQVWLPGEAAAPLLEADFSRTSLYAEMWHRLGVAPSGGKEEISAVNMTRSEAELLGVRSRTAGFLLLRLGRVHGRPWEWRRTLIRGDRFRMLSRFAPGAAVADRQWSPGSTFGAFEKP